jgi:hypothetical protein
MHFFHPVAVLELLVTEVSLVPSVIFMPIPVFVVSVGVPMPMSMPRIPLVLMRIAVAVVIVMLGKSGNARCNAQCQNRGKANSNQSHRCLSTAERSADEPDYAAEAFPRLRHIRTCTSEAISFDSEIARSGIQPV